MNKKSGRSSIVLRLLKLIKEFYPVMMPVTIVCIVFSAIVSSVPAVFMQNVIAVIEQSWQTGDWAAVLEQAGYQMDGWRGALLDNTWCRIYHYVPAAQ